MAEVPKHLLERAAARRAALSGAPAPESTSAAPAATESKAVAVAASAPATSAGSGGGAGSVPAAASTPVPAGPPKLPRGTTFSRVGAAFLLAVTPIWALYMFNSFATPSSKTLTPEKIGQNLYEANCASCHLGNGAGKDGGGVGRALWNKETERTFPKPIDQVAFVKHGSCATGTPYGDPKREGGQHVAQGGMPKFEGVLSDQEILYVVQYERANLSNQPFPTDLLAGVGETADPAAVATAPIEEVKTENVCG